MLMESIDELGESIGISEACGHLGVSRSTWYRWKNPSESHQKKSKVSKVPPRTLNKKEREGVRQILNSERFRNMSPRQVYATLLDEGVYYCHWSTMYRILEEYEEVRERRNQLTHPTYAKPELLATGPNQLWTWDITKLKGSQRLTYYYLYVMIDVYSRYVVGWMLEEAESEVFARCLIEETYKKQNIAQSQLTIHADRGAPMIAKSVEQLMADLQITKSHSRPYTPNDNPYSESQFKTLKYHPSYPGRFQSFDDAHTWVATLIDWSNNQHYHSALNLLTPAIVHYGYTPQVLAHRQQVLNEAYHKHPERFVHGQPQLRPLPERVGINLPPSAQ